jgi:beta-lactamase regulating signal transducer with metallopeptidase domain/tetratricopeptide (TPR) repeat protein
MNTYIETLNHWGENVLAFAWPMLWQSSLLIVVVATLDFLLARKIRPAIRHALWMIVLVKLLLPPTLALPTGAAWWLWPAKPALTPVLKSETVTFDTTALPENPAVRLVDMAPPPPQLDADSWIMLMSGALSAGLLCWLAFKWLSVGRNARKAKTAHEFENLLGEARQLAGLRGPVRLRLIDDEQSPAVYGFFRPVILLPRALAERLSEKQLQAVLLHEVIHVRRGDVWVNCAQTLLQIFYWWHPLLWLANARIRRLREEAVDDAVMLAMRDEADAYAPTLLEVAKFAFRRPLASLGLVGILESRSALRQRIERLVDFRPPRRAGVTLLSLCGIFAFSAVALPMGQAPVSTTDSVSANPQLSSADAPPTKTAIQIDGSFFWMRPSDIDTLTAGLPSGLGQSGQARKWTAGAEKWGEINQRIHSLNAKFFDKPRITTSSGMEADLYCSNQTYWYRFDCTPSVADGHVNLAVKAEICLESLHDTTYLIAHEHATVENNGGVILRVPDPSNTSSNLVLVIGVKTVDPARASEKNAAAAANVWGQKQNTDVLVRDGRMLYEIGKLDEAQSKLKSALALDPDNQGALYYLSLIAQAKVAPPSGQASIDDGRKSVFYEINSIHLDEFGPYEKAPLPEVINELNRRALNAGADFKIVLSPMTPSPNTIFVSLPQMKDVAFGTIFAMLPQEASQPVNYSIMDDTVFFESVGNDLEIRTFKLNTNAFLTNLGKEYKPQGNLGRTIREAFSEAGVDLSPPKTLFYNDGMGVLFVQATRRDLDVIERVVQGLNQPSQIHIKARFIEMPSNWDDADTPDLLSAIERSNSGYGILTAAEMKAVWQQLQSQNGVDELAEPEGTTLSGRDMQMRASGTQPVAVNDMLTPISNAEFGPILDVSPFALADGYTINLTASAERIQIKSPAIKINSASTPVALLYDGQTLVLFPKEEQPLPELTDEKSRERAAEQIRQAEKKNGNKTLVVFVTATLIDSVGNRIHSDDEMSFAQNAIPAQPQILPAKQDAEY